MSFIKQWSYIPGRMTLLLSQQEMQEKKLRVDALKPLTDMNEAEKVLNNTTESSPRQDSTSVSIIETAEKEDEP